MKPTTYHDYRARIETVLRHVRTHLDQRLAPEDLARLASFSPHHFHRIFRGMVGESLAGYVRRMRLERAALWLQESDHSVLRIALDSGYTAHEPFTRAFKRHFGETPTSFRNRAEPAVMPDAANGIHYADDHSPLHLRPYSGEDPMLDVTIRTIEPMRIAAIRHVGPYGDIGSAFERIVAWSASKGLLGPDTKVVGIYHDDPRETPADELRSDAGVRVPDSVPDDPEAAVAIVEVPAGEYAVGTLKGSYEQLPAAYDWFIGQWLPTSGREADDRPCVDVYLNSPTNTAPDALLTEIHLPLK